MDGAWVGPLYWIQWAGGHRRLHPRGRRTGPGGELRLPDCALAERCGRPVRSVCGPGRPKPIWLKSDGGLCGQLALLPRDLRAHGVFLGSASGAHSRRRFGGGWLSGPSTVRRRSGRRAVGGPLQVGRRSVSARSSIRRSSVADPSAVRSSSVGHPVPVCPRCPAADLLLTGSIHPYGGALQGAQAAPGALPCASFVAAWCPVRTVHWLSTACGGGDAMVGGVEQHRRQSA
jgi:hypothetical protein